MSGAYLFLFIAVLAGAALGLVRSHISTVVKMILLTMLALVAVVLVYWTSPQRHLGVFAWYQQTPWREGILFSLMLAGMTSRVLAVAIETRRRRIHHNANGANRLGVDIWDLFYPLLFSAMTFGVVLANVGDRVLDWSTVILAYQNGFFWQTILKSHSK